MTNRLETTIGSRKVVSTRNVDGVIWTSCLYVNNGETITALRATHSTEQGARKWAAKALAQ